MKSAIIYRYKYKDEEEISELKEYFVPYEAKSLARYVETYNEGLANKIRKGAQKGNCFERLVAKLHLNRFLEIENINYEKINRKIEWINDYTDIEEVHLGDYLFEIEAVNRGVDVITKSEEEEYQSKYKVDNIDNIYKSQDLERDFKLYISILSYLDEDDLDENEQERCIIPAFESVDSSLFDKVIDYYELLESFIVNCSRFSYARLCDKYNEINNILSIQGILYDELGKNENLKNYYPKKNNGYDPEYEALIDILSAQKYIEYKKQINKIRYNEEENVYIIHHSILQVIKGKSNQIYYDLHSIVSGSLVIERMTETLLGGINDVGTLEMKGAIFSNYYTCVSEAMRIQEDNTINGATYNSMAYIDDGASKLFNGVSNAIKKGGNHDKYLRRFFKNNNSKKHEGNACYAVMKTKNGDMYCSLSGIDDYYSKKKVMNVYNYITKRISYSVTYKSLTKKTERYTNIMNKKNDRIIYILPTSDFGSDLLQCTPISNKQAQLTYACVERKLLTNIKNGANTKVKTNIDYIVCKYTPCKKCQPAVYNASIQHFYAMKNAVSGSILKEYRVVQKSGVYDVEEV